MMPTIDATSETIASVFVPGPAGALYAGAAAYEGAAW
jgi:hypothetical protein